MQWGFRFKRGEFEAGTWAERLSPRTRGTVPRFGDGRPCQANTGEAKPTFARVAPHHWLSAVSGRDSTAGKHLLFQYRLIIFQSLGFRSVLGWPTPFFFFSS